MICVSVRDKRREADKYAFLDTEINVFSILVLLRQRAALFLQVLPVAFDVLDHQVLPGQLIVVWEVG